MKNIFLLLLNLLLAYHNFAQTSIPIGWFGIDKISKDLGTETFDGQKFPPSEVMHENEIWIESKIEESYVIYDRGYVGNNSPYYQMELQHTANYNNVYHVRVIYISHKQTIRIYYIK